jgi:alanine racemase
VIDAAERRGAWLTIDLAAIQDNYRRLRARLASGARLAAVVKADAYGLGAAKVAPALLAAGCRDFFVATLDEGLSLKPLLGQARLFVLNGPMPGSERCFAERGLIPVLNQLDQIARWAQVARTTNAPAALHIDTGMCRLGLAAEDLDWLGEEPAGLDGVAIALVVSHLAAAEARDSPQNRDQLERFRAALARLPRPAANAPRSLANSSGLFLGPDYHLDLVRAGAALYGVNPLSGAPNPMSECLRLRAKILQVRHVDSPMSVGYGATHRVTRKGRIATIAVGYADGMPRALSNRADAMIGGKSVPLVGRVSMDLITLDVTDLDPNEAAPGAVVDLIGGGIALDRVATNAGTIGYEILTGLAERTNGRLPRIYVGEGTG